MRRSILICDVCEKEIKGSVKYNLTYNGVTMIMTSDKDVCPSCLDAWLKGLVYAIELSERR